MVTTAIVACSDSIVNHCVTSNIDEDDLDGTCNDGEGNIVRFNGIFIFIYIYSYIIKFRLLLLLFVRVFWTVCRLMYRREAVSQISSAVAY